MVERKLSNSDWTAFIWHKLLPFIHGLRWLVEILRLFRLSSFKISLIMRLWNLAGLKLIVSRHVLLSCVACMFLYITSVFGAAYSDLGVVLV